MGNHQANGDIESVVRTLKAQMIATKFVLESRLGRQLAHSDYPILTRVRKGPRWQDALGRERGEREQGRKWPGYSLQFGERFFMKEAKERGSGAFKKDWEPRFVEARYLGQHARTGAMITITADGIVCGRLTSITRSRALGSDRLAGSQRSAMGSSTDGRASAGGRC